MSNLGPAIIRFAHPLAFSAFLQKVGAPVDSYFQRQGLPALCRDPNAFVPVQKAWALFDDASRREDRMVGWHVGRFVGDHKLSAGLLKRLDNAPTLLQALRNLVRLVSTEASHLQIGIQEGHSCVLFYTHYSGMRDVPGYSVSQAYQLEVYIDLIRHFAGADWQPREIGIEDSIYPKFLEDWFPDCQIRINQPFGYVAIPRSCLHRKIRSPHYESKTTPRLIETTKLNHAELLTVLLEPYLQDGYLSMKFAASLTDSSKRTLARRLADCETSYQAVIDNVRFSKAKRLLEKSDISVADIAWSLGFSDQANFTRMFRRIGGLSPRQFRRIECRTLH